MSDFEYTTKSSIGFEEEEELEDMEEGVAATLFREMCTHWLQTNGLKIVLEEVRDRPRPRYRRQNAKANMDEEH